MISRSFFSAFLIFALHFPLPCGAAPISLTSGKGALIELSPEASTTELYAARELQHVIKGMSGVELSIRQENATADNRPVIRIGTPGDARTKAALEKHGSPLQADEEIAIWRDDSVLYLVGQTPRAALYATYTFLQNHLGARWLWPGPDGEFLPKREEITIDNIEYRHSPSLSYRSISINNRVNSFDGETDIWMARNRMNVQNAGTTVPPSLLEQRKEMGFLNRISGHNIKLPQEILEAHPEYAAYFAGERQLKTRVPPQLCWSNPEVVRLVAAEVVKWWEISPLVDFISFYPSDNSHFCQCDACTAMGSVSTRWQKFSSQVIAEVENRHPGKKYMTLAYQSYRDVPKEELAPFVNTGYCLYNGCYRHTYFDSCSANDKALEEVKEWQARGGKMSIRGYEMILFKDPIFTPLVSFMRDQAKWASREGLVGLSTEISPLGHPKGAAREDQQWATKRISCYAMARAMWDADVKAETIVTEWNTAIYGPAATTMSELYFAMEEAWRSAPGHISYFLNPPASSARDFITPGLIAKVEALFIKAEKEAASITEESPRQRALHELAFERRLFTKWKELAQLQESRRDHYEVYAVRTAAPPALTAEADDPAWEKAARLPAFEDGKGNVTKDQTDVRLLWDETALYARFICYDSSGRAPRTQFRERDTAIYGDDSIEIFLYPAPAASSYFHLAANALGAQYDAAASAGMNLDRSWNGGWKAVAKPMKGGWIVDIAFPFQAFNLSPGAGEDVFIHFNRNRPGQDPAHPSSGWPDASWHNPSAYGKVRLVETMPLPIAFFPGAKQGDSLLAAMRELSLRPVRVASEGELQAALEAPCGGVILRYPWGRQAPLSSRFLGTVLSDYIRQGGRTLLVSRGRLPLEEWFSGLSVAWEDTPFHPLRRTSHLQEGNWLSIPHDLRPIFKKGITPRHAYRPLSKGWEILATLKLEDGRDAPFLLRHALGKGELFLTSSAFAFSGRQEIFGDSHAIHAARLIENLFAGPLPGNSQD